MRARSALPFRTSGAAGCLLTLPRALPFPALHALTWPAPLGPRTSSIVRFDCLIVSFASLWQREEGGGGVSHMEVTGDSGCGQGAVVCVGGRPPPPECLGRHGAELDFSSQPTLSAGRPLLALLRALPSRVLSPGPVAGLWLPSTADHSRGPPLSWTCGLCALTPRGPAPAVPWEPRAHASGHLIFQHGTAVQTPQEPQQRTLPPSAPPLPGLTQQDHGPRRGPRGQSREHH